MEDRLRPETPLDLDFASKALGYDVHDLQPYDPDEPYDERFQLVQEALDARQTLQGQMRRAADAAGIKVSEEEIANWQPNERDFGSLNYMLRRQRQRLTMIDGVSDYLYDQEQHAHLLGVPMRRHQVEVVKNFEHFLVHDARSWADGGKGGIIEMPTGTGKTGIFANIAAALKYAEQETDPVRVLVLVPTQTILEQTMGREGERGFGKFAPHLNVGAYYQDEKELSHDVVVMCNASFNTLMAEGRMPQFDAVIVDEVHTAIAEKTGENLRGYCADKIAVGLSATPEFNPERTAYTLFEHQIAQLDLPAAVRMGLLAPVRAHLLEAEGHIDYGSLPGDPVERQKAIRAARLDARMLAAENIIKEAIGRGVGVVVRCPAGDDIDHAVKFAERLSDMIVRIPNADFGMRWIDARAIGGSYRRQTAEERRMHLSRYDRGEADVLTYVKALGMGWDSPHAKVFINLSPTSSAVEMIQAIGRVLRLSYDANSQPIYADVYDFKEPGMRNQYTPLSALNLESGQVLEHEPFEPALEPQRQRRRRTQAAELEGVTTSTLGEMAIEHAQYTPPPTQAEIIAAAATRHKDNIPLNEAAQILGVSPTTMHGILLSVGSNPQLPIHTNDLPALLEMLPDLRAEPLPAEGYLSARQIANDAPALIRLFTLLPFARMHGIHPTRFIDHDGKVGFYFEAERQEELYHLLEAEYWNKRR
jgi:superfamily II DNA or RNA helicase